MAVFPSNTTLVFNNPTGAFTENLLGMPETTIEKILIVAYTRETTKREDPTMDRDAAVYNIELAGRCNNPAALPNSIKPGSQADALIWRIDSRFRLPRSFTDITAYENFVIANSDRILQRGVFQLRADVGSAFGVQKILGDKLRGYLTTEVQWAEAI